jgi:dihydrofolate synthase / folylpolyglutamate synthase
MPGHPFERLSYDEDYDQALSYLYNLQKFGIKFGLSQTENLLKVFENPEKGLSLIHIAGSNGKGSVAAVLASIYGRAGYKVGLFTSPHLVDFRERFQINGRLISKGHTLDLIKEIKDRTDPLEPPTFFEFVTAMALLYFHREKVDLAIMEVGLGGRLDATNIIHPLISVITTIALEHQEYLGKTLQEIALEKAGIIKFQVPLVTGVNQKKVQALLEGVCLEKQAPMFLAGRDFRTRKVGNGKFSYNSLIPQSTIGNLKLKGLALGLLGDHQIKNAGLALTVVNNLINRFPVPEEEVRQGLAQVRWPGRLEVLSERPVIVLDGAHNPGAMKALSQNLAKVFSYKRLLLVFGMMKDKDIGKTFKLIMPIADICYLTRAQYDRSADPETFIPYVQGKNLPYHIRRTIPEAIHLARQEAGPEDLILITGSLFIVGEARAWWEREGLNL